MYSNITSIQHILHTALQLNDFEIRLESVKQSLQMCFSYNMQNHARFASYYVEILLNGIKVRVVFGKNNEKKAIRPSW